MVIWPARLAEKYITAEERKAILTKVNDYAQTDDWFPALSTIISRFFNFKLTVYKIGLQKKYQTS